MDHRGHRFANHCVMGAAASADGEPGLLVEPGHVQPLEEQTTDAVSSLPGVCPGGCRG